MVVRKCASTLRFQLFSELWNVTPRLQLNAATLQLADKPVFVSVFYLLLFTYLLTFKHPEVTRVHKWPTTSLSLRESTCIAHSLTSDQRCVWVQRNLSAVARSIAWQVASSYILWLQFNGVHACNFVILVSLPAKTAMTCSLSSTAA